MNVAAMHTPGAWEVVPLGNMDFRCPGEYGAKDMAIVGPKGICTGIVWEFGSEGEANARLIAASPRILDAARRAADLLRRCDPAKTSPAQQATDSEWDEVVREIDAAIALAVTP